MKKMMTALTVALFTFGLIVTSFAQTPASETRTRGINKRQRREQRRIAHGIENGSLTAKEAEKLEGREAKIQQDKQAAKADGTVTPQERRKLRREENRASRAIRRQKHDQQHR